jgi:hypothetical protein
MHVSSASDRNEASADFDWDQAENQIGNYCPWPPSTFGSKQIPGRRQIDATDEYILANSSKTISQNHRLLPHVRDLVARA